MTSPVVRDGVIYVSVQSYGDASAHPQVRPAGMARHQPGRQADPGRGAPRSSARSSTSSDKNKDGVLTGDELDTAFQSPDQHGRRRQHHPGDQGRRHGRRDQDARALEPDRTTAPSNLSSPLVVGDQLFVVKKGGLSSCVRRRHGQDALGARSGSATSATTTPRRSPATARSTSPGENGFVVVLADRAEAEGAGQERHGRRDASPRRPSPTAGSSSARATSCTASANEAPGHAPGGDRSCDRVPLPQWSCFAVAPGLLVRSGRRPARGRGRRPGRAARWSSSPPRNWPASSSSSSTPRCRSSAARSAARREHVILVGSPATNPAVKAAVGDSWPKLTDQGHRAPQRERTTAARRWWSAAAVPVATLWAVYELGHRFGIRYLLHGDVLPGRAARAQAGRLRRGAGTHPPHPRLADARRLSPSAPSRWGLAEHKRLLAPAGQAQVQPRRAARSTPGSRSSTIEFKGVKKQHGGPRVRPPFSRRRRHAGPGGLQGRDGVRQSRLRRQDHLRRADRRPASPWPAASSTRPVELRHVHRHRRRAAGVPQGVRRRVARRPRSCPASEGLAVGPGPPSCPTTRVLKDLATTQLRAYLTTYPDVDALYLRCPESRPAGRSTPTRPGSGSTPATASARRDLQALTATAASASADRLGERGVRGAVRQPGGTRFLRHASWPTRTCSSRPDGAKVTRHLARAIDPALFPVLDQVVPPRTRGAALPGLHRPPDRRRAGVAGRGPGRAGSGEQPDPAAGRRQRGRAAAATHAPLHQVARPPAEARLGRLLDALRARSATWTPASTTWPGPASTPT